MIRLVLFSFLSLIVSSVKCNPSTSKYTYNSSDLSYLSNGIQFPIESGFQVLIDEGEAENDSQILWFSRLYDHHRWFTRLEKLDNELCKHDMMVYLMALNNSTSWAVKMFDASGRYSGQFFFGNDYWLGSKTLCYELSKQEWNAETPPFKVNFYVVKVRININKKATPVTRQINVGECLPTSCGVTGVRSLLTQERNQAASVNIVGVRKVPGDYSLFADFKVHLLGGCSLVVLFMVFISTIVDYLKINNYYSSNKSEIQKHQHIENNNVNGTNFHFKTENAGCVRNADTQTFGKDQTGTLLKLLLTFSAISNGKKIISVKRISLESIQCIHGLRFFSIAWIILVHSYLELFAISDNKNLRILTERGFMYQTISNATFSVDTFFFISGLLITITYFRSHAKKQKYLQSEGTLQVIKSTTGNVFMMILYRFFRLTPAYLFVLVLNEIIMRYLHSNSVFSPAIIDHISCNNYWWRNILYINNFFPQNEFCMLWSWYMANDTQFYIIASILLVIAVRGSKHVKFAGILIILFMGASWVTTFIIAMNWEYVARVEEPFALFDQLYDKPWLRIGPYLIGIISVTLGWVMSLGCLGSLVYGLGRQGLVLPASAFYAALGHTAWGLSIAWITTACCSGYGGPLNSILSCKFFLPLSRLTYCAYLVHPVLMCLTSFHLDGSLHLHEAMVVVIYCGNVVLSFLAAFAISIMFEAPVVNLLKIFFG